MLWMAVTGLLMIAIVVFNSDRRMLMVSSSMAEGSQTIQTKSALQLPWMRGTAEDDPTKKKPIQWISVLGERNSGTRWLYT